MEHTSTINISASDTDEVKEHKKHIAMRSLFLRMQAKTPRTGKFLLTLTEKTEQVYGASGMPIDGEFLYTTKAKVE